MKLYKLRYTMREPSYDTEDKYMAEIPALPGCRAWGDTPAETLDFLQSVAAATIDVYNERGYKLPIEVETAAIDSRAANDILVIERL